MPLSNPQPSVDQNSIAITGGTISGVTIGSATLQVVNGLDTQVSASKPTVRSAGGALQAGDRWLNTTDRLWFYWNGTYWLSENVYQNRYLQTTVSSSIGVNSLETPNGYNFFLVSIAIAGSFSSPQNSTSRHIYDFRRVNTSGVTSTIASVSTESLNLAAGSIGATLYTNAGTHINVSSLGVAYFGIVTSALSAPGSISGAVFSANYRLAAI